MLRQSGIDYANQRRRPNSSRLIFLLVGVAIALAAIVFLYFWLSLAPVRNIQSQTQSIVKTYGIVQIDRFMISNGKTVYYSIIGRTSGGSKRVAIVKKNSQKATVLQRSLGMSDKNLEKLIQDRYKPQKVFSVALAMYKGQPVWQVAYQSKNTLNYALLDFQSGDEYQLIKGI